MNVAVVYVYPQVKIQTYFPLAKRFADTWKQFPPKSPVRLHIVCNGGPASPHERAPFDDMNPRWHVRTNMGWDIGAYQWAADNLDCDLLVCLGAPVHFHKPGWLEKMADAYIANGPALYGCWAYLSPNWHVRTTAFWLPPQLLQSYPYVVGTTRQSRYEFEHGNKSLTRHVLKAGLGCYFVSQAGCFPFKEWTNRGPTPKESLLLDQFTYEQKPGSLKSR